jgi:hypothetical protein
VIITLHQSLAFAEIQQKNVMTALHERLLKSYSSLESLESPSSRFLRFQAEGQLEKER